ncbi:MAG: ABC transporter permease [Anaerolineae bacterium]|nr:ABC transporter permease [Anaerolineae bacterium]
MFGLKLERAPAPLWMRGVIPLIAIALTFVLVSVLVIAAGADPVAAFFELLINPLTKNSARLDILVLATPIILTGVAVSLAFACGYYNIGAEGQLYAGAIAAGWIGTMVEGASPLVAIPLMLVGGFAAGALWALLPALLKVRLRVDEVVTTLLLNSVMLFIVSAPLNGPWRDPETGWPQSPTIAEAAQFPQIIARSRVHLGFLVALVVAGLVWWLLTRTRFGLELRAVGKNRDAAQFLGIRVGRMMLVTALISGGIAGLAGVGEVAGIQFHVIDSLSPGFGYTGIIVATLGALTIPGALLAALFLALVSRGALSASRELSVPVYLGDVIQAALLMVMLTALLLDRYRLRRSNP